MNNIHDSLNTRSPTRSRILVIEALPTENSGENPTPVPLIAPPMAQLMAQLMGELVRSTTADQAVGDVVMATGREGLALWRSQPFALVILPLTNTDDLAVWASRFAAPPIRAETAVKPLILVVVPPGQDALAHQAIQQGAWDYWVPDAGASSGFGHRVALAIAHHQLIQNSRVESLSTLSEQQAKRQLQDLSERLTLALDAAFLGTWDWDLTHDVNWDASMYRLYGLEGLNRSATYEDWRSHLHPDDRERAEQLLQQAIVGTADFDVEFRIRRPDGELRWIHAIAQVQRDAHQQAVRMVGINRDITVQKQHQLALQASETRFRQVFSSNVVGMLFTDFSGEIWDANDYFLQLVGYPREDLQARRINWVNLTPPEHRQADLEAMATLRREGSLPPLAKDYVRKDGSRVAVLVSVALFNSQDTGCVCVVLDLSERKRIEEDLRHANRELLRATQLKDEFLASMSHELRTQLNAILGIAEGLQEEVFGSMGDRQRHALQIIERSGNHLLALINDILDLAKIEAGQVILNRETVAISALCESSLVFVRQQALQKRIGLHLDIDDRLPLVMLDERRMRQVLINLLNNAVKFTGDRGTVTLTARLVTGYGGDDPRLQAVASSAASLQFVVTDTGIGIDAADLPRLFQPFVQVDGDLDRQYAGTGLGLALVKHIVELHDGTVTVESELGLGSCFTVTVPLVTNVPVPSPLAQPAIAASSPTPHSPSAQPRILLVEDHEANRMGVVDYLEMKGYEVWIAEDGEAAIAQTQAQVPDLILMDVQMPKLDGFETTCQLRQDDRLDRVPILMLTALAMPGDRERCLAAGANDYLAKPIPLKSLERHIQHWLPTTPAPASISRDGPGRSGFEAHLNAPEAGVKGTAIE